MNLESIFENFDLLAESPNGIKKLRDMILQMAVQGKLVPQNKDDEPASVLLEKIKAEKEMLVKEGIIKKPKKSSPIEDVELPYFIPINWEWVCLSDIVYNFGQKKPDVEFTYIDVASINKEMGVISSDVQTLTPENAPSRARKIVKNGCVIYSTVRPYLLNIAIVDSDFNPEPIVSTAFAVLNPYSNIYNKYLYYYLRSQPFTAYVESEMIGMAYPAINDSKLYKGLVPLPPLEEQKRIVEKVDQLMALCNQLESFQQKKKESRSQLNNSALNKMLDAGSSEEFAEHWQLVCENFDLLYDDLDNVEKLKQAILQLAVQGKLVEQDENDEPAGVLLEKIKDKNKIKKSKGILPVKNHEEIFNIHNNWVWARFGEVATIESNLVKPDGYMDLPHVAPNNIEKGTGKLLEYTTIREDGVTSAKHYFYPGQLLYSKIRPNLSKVVIIDFEGLCSADMYPIRAHIETRYLHLNLLSKIFLNQVISDDNRVAMPKVNQQQLVNILVPLPPLEEQKRIVEKVDVLTNLCEQLKMKIIDGHKNTETLMDAVLIEAVGEFK